MYSRNLFDGQGCSISIIIVGILLIMLITR